MQVQTVQTKGKKTAPTAARMPKKAGAKTQKKEVSPVVLARQPQGEVRNFKLSNCVHSILNTRKKKHTAEQVAELADLIAAHTILQNLIGYMQKRKGKETGFVEIVAGGGRLDGCHLLLSQGRITDEYPVPVKIVSEEEAIQVSLAENSGRVGMHLADQYLAMKMMIEDHGKHIDELAVAYGLTPLRVKRRLALANVAPSLFELFRDDKMTYEQLMAFTLCDDHATQERIWKDTPQNQRHPHTLRRLITTAEINMRTDPLAKFVGVKAYEKAGGEIRRDLFSDNDDGFMKDAVLLEKLAVEKLEAKAEAMRADGWKWVEVSPRIGLHDINAFARISNVRREPTADEQAKLDALAAEEQKLQEAYDAPDADEDDIEQKMSSVIDQTDAIEESLIVPNPDEKALAGVILRVDQDGKLAIHNGLIREEDRKAIKKARAATASEEGAGPTTTEAAKPIHSERLTRHLSAHRTAALQALVATHPNIALVVLTHRMAKSIFSSDLYNTESICELSITPPFLKTDAPDIEQSRAYIEMQTKRDAWRKRLPTKGKQSLFAWLLEQPLEDVLSLMSFCTACGIRAIQTRDERMKPADELAQALDLDMADWWSATTESYFGHVSKSRIAAVVTEAVSADVGNTIGAMKKGDAAAAAEKAVDGKRWIPELFRLK